MLRICVDCEREGAERYLFQLYRFGGKREGYLSLLYVLNNALSNSLSKISISIFLGPFVIPSTASSDMRGKLHPGVQTPEDERCSAAGGCENTFLDTL